MIIVDAHLDLGPLALRWNRDVTLPVAEIRQAEAGMSDKPWRAQGAVALPEMRLGRVAVAVAAIWSRTGPSPSDCSSRGITYAFAQGQLAYYRLLAAEGHCRLILDGQDLASHVGEWRDWDRLHPSHSAQEAGETPKLGLVLGMECADAILHPDQVEAWWRDGLRLIGLAHGAENVYAHGDQTKGKGGLKPGAAEILANMRRLGMILDVAHLSDQSFWEAMDLWDGPLMASHSSCRAFVPGQRQLDDRQIRTLAERDGVIGIMLWAKRLLEGWGQGGSPREAVSLDTVADHIDHICQLAGSAEHVGIGSDLDGGFGRGEIPHEMDTIADLQLIPDTLARRGYKPGEIAGIMHGNWLRFLSRHLAERSPA